MPGTSTLSSASTSILSPQVPLGRNRSARWRSGHTPGLKAFGTAGAGPIRGIFYDPGVERLFCVSGGEFYEVGEGGAATKLGDVATGVLPVTWASNGVGGQRGPEGQHPGRAARARRA